MCLENFQHDLHHKLTIERLKYEINQAGHVTIDFLRMSYSSDCDPTSCKGGQNLCNNGYIVVFRHELG